ncbi:hypothetical protein LPTSP4_06600 [Leptospira ryugenii]|uniref:Uncharacterized protein n=1 Tax=Leptospira ryugenii TaxID=1917863 RepID=A0A2P2DX46_9LEPT|nr:hypothetical protein [Leptospira ryugenii]GBF49150.1 hypothetical protein LPTSP4_06600 [Leptospira ryugenii]
MKNHKIVSIGKSLPEKLRQFFAPLEPIPYLFPILLIFYFVVSQGIETAKLKRMIREKVVEKDDLIRRNDDLKIGIVSYTSAERIEALYRRTYQYLPVSVGNRIVTIELPKEPEIKK